jgi:O-antigen biosynthesis protein
VPRLSAVEENVFELHVRLPREPVYHCRMLRTGEEAAIESAVETALTALGTRRAVQVVSFPLWYPVADRLRRRAGYPLIYDCHDYLGGFKNVSRDVVCAEEESIEGADIVIVSSQELLERHGRRPGQTMLVRNAADYEHFQTAESGTVPRPVAGYIGALDWWFDVESIERAARENVGCDFVLAGRTEHPSVESLAKLPNVKLLGEVPYAELPALMARFTVGLIPFRVNDFTRAANPIKLYEYFSRGIPVVSSRLPEVDLMNDLVYTYDSSSECASQLSRAVAEDDPLRQARRRQTARCESWAARASAISLEIQARWPEDPVRSEGPPSDRAVL